MLWLHSQDPYKPSDLLTHIRHTTPMRDGKPIKDLPELDLDNLEIVNQFGPHIPLTSNDDPTTYPAWLFGEAPDAAGKIHNSTPSCVIVVERGPLDLDAFYFYFYSYNEGPNVTQVLEPLKHLVDNEKIEAGMNFGDHVGDWLVMSLTPSLPVANAHKGSITWFVSTMGRLLEFTTVNT